MIATSVGSRWHRRSLIFRSGQIEPDLADPTRPVGRQLAILVHGFNNDMLEAEQNYSDALDKLAGSHDSPIPSAVLDRVWGFFWPGFVEPPWRRVDRLLFPYLREERLSGFRGSSLLTAPNYGAQVPKAVEAGRALGKYITDLVDPYGMPTRVILIAHSLGCRVVIEALEVLRKTDTIEPAARVKAVCLMAAAVPTDYLQTPYSKFWEVAQSDVNSIVLYSRRDTVLRFFFQPGQFLAPGEESSSPAVGLHGRPPGLWTGRDETMLRHGEYWESRVTRPHLARLFGAATTAELPEIRIVDWELPSQQLQLWQEPRYRAAPPRFL